MRYWKYILTGVLPFALFQSPLLAQATVQSGDGLRIGFHPSGEASALRFAEQDVPLVPGAFGGFLASDPSQGAVRHRMSGSAAQTGDNQASLDLAAPIGLQVRANVTAQPTAIRFEGEILSTINLDRPVEFCFVLPRQLSNGLTWHADMHERQLIAPNTRRQTVITEGWDIEEISRSQDRLHFDYENPINLYPLSYLGDNLSGLSFAVPPSEPSPFYTYYDAGDQEYGVCFHLGLSPKTRNFPNKAHFSFLVFANEQPAWGFRSAFEKLADMFPESFGTRLPEPGMIGSTPDVNTSAFPDVRPYHFQSSWFGLNQRSYNDSLGIIPARYLWLYGEFDRRVVYRRTQTGSAGAGHVEELAKAFYNGVLDRAIQPKYRADGPHFAGWRQVNPQGATYGPFSQWFDPSVFNLELIKVANIGALGKGLEEFAAAWIEDRGIAYDGRSKHLMISTFYTYNDGEGGAAGYPGGAVTHYEFFLNPSPYLEHQDPRARPYLNFGRQMIREAKTVTTTGGFPGEGVARALAFDVMGVSLRGDFNANHFATATMPLSYDARNNRLVYFEWNALHEWLAEARRELGNGVYFFGNGQSMSSYLISELDAYISEEEPLFHRPGNEERLFRRYRLRRTLGIHKPYTYWIRDYQLRNRPFMDPLVFHGFYPYLKTFFGQSRSSDDKELYLSYLNIVHALNVAGWEPVTYATTNSSDILVERWGPAPDASDIYFSVLNRGSSSREYTLSIDAARVAIASIGSIVEFLDGRPVSFSENAGGLTINHSIGAGQAQVFRISFAERVDNPPPDPGPDPDPPPASAGLTIPFLRGVVADGDLREWTRIDGAVFSDGSAHSGKNRVVAKSAYDLNNLYVAFEVSDSALHADAPEIWRNDSVEFMIDTLGDGGDRMRNDDYHFIVDVEGRRLDQRGQDFAWESGFVSAVRKSPNQGYAVEMAIPWAAIGGAPADGSVVGIDYASNDQDAGGGYSPFDWSGLTSFLRPSGWQAGVIGPREYRVRIGLGEAGN